MSQMGLDLLAKSLIRCGVEDFFYLIGGPMTKAMEATVRAGARGVDVRDERAASYAAIAYSRLRRRPGVVMSCAGPGTTNTVTGVSHAHVDGSPIVVIGGSSPMYQHGWGAFQETDQVGVMRPITKWAHQIQAVENIPDVLSRAFRVATSGRPGPVYIDLPADVLYGEANEEVVQWPSAESYDTPFVSGLAPQGAVHDALEIVAASHRPLVVAGSGVHWSHAEDTLKTFVERAGMPFITTPMARGVVPEDHPLCFPAARSKALGQADCILLLGARINYVVDWLRAPVVNSDAKVVMVNSEPDDLAQSHRPEIALLSDVRLGIEALIEGFEALRISPDFSSWASDLAEAHRMGREKAGALEGSDEAPIHPMRLCAELRRLLSRESVLVVDGHEILGFSRKSVPAYQSGYTLTPGPYGTMGIGIAFGIGASVARPEAPTVVLTGDGAAGYHLMELDTAVRHQLPLVVVISNNGGWTGARAGRPGRALEYSDYHLVSKALGGLGVKVERPQDISSAIARAIQFASEERRPAVVNVLTSTAENVGRSFIQYRREGGADEYAPA